MLKDHIEVLLDEQETFNKSHHTEGTRTVFVNLCLQAMFLLNNSQVVAVGAPSETRVLYTVSSIPLGTVTF